MSLEFFNQRINNTNIVDLAHTSCLGALSQCLTEMKALRLLAEDAVVFLSENHAFETGVPDTDVLLFAGFACEEDNRVYNISFQLGVSMYDDVNLHRHYRALSYLYDRFEVLGSFNLFDGQSNKIGQIEILDGKLVSPVTKVNIRTIQTITIDCLASVTHT